MNLFAPRQVTKRGYEVNLSETKRVVLENGREILTGNTEDFWILKLNILHTYEKVYIAQSLKRWHERLGHQNKKQVEKILKKFNIDYLKEDFFCEACVHGKQARLPFPTTGTQTNHSGEIIHSDICEMDEFTLGGSKYFVIFKDDYSHYNTVYTLKHKNEVQEKLKSYLKLIKN